MDKASLFTPDKNLARQKLTALWALAESGIGGIMFAARIPFTGFIIGAISIILLSLIAKYSDYKAKSIIQSTLLVILVKAAVSPHSPPPAYLAVFIQGMLAAFLFGWLKQKQIAVLLLGIITMLESALQKILVLTIIFGKEIWLATNKFIAETFHFAGTNTSHSFLWYIFIFYLLIYAVWGFFTGRLAHRLPVMIEQRKEQIITDYQAYSHENKILPVNNIHKRKWRRFIIYGVILSFIIAVYFFSGSTGKKLALIFGRSILIIFILFFVLQPLLKYLLQNKFKKLSIRHAKETDQILAMLPQLKQNAKAGWYYALQHKGIVKRLRYFLIFMIVTGLYAPEK